MQKPFYGRKRELKLLNDLTLKKTPSLVVIRGRRRIGKSRLVQEFGQNRRFLAFEGIPPDKKVSASLQREDFAGQLQRTLNIPKPRADDWGDLFWILADHAKDGPVCLLLDEINWMGDKDPTFLGKLKNAWDQRFSNNPQLILILCGSVSGWIERNILKSTGFFGRISLDLVLEALPLRECRHFWHPREERIAPFEIFKVLAVTGGIPRYLEEIDPRLSAEDNIRKLCFQKEGLLFSEFERIFLNLFSRRTPRYQSIVQLLVDGSISMEELRTKLGSKSSTISDYVDDLEKAGFVSRDYSWNIKNGKVSKFSKIRLSDNYLRFYLKFIEPNATRIKRGVSGLPSNLPSIFGLQFENLVLNNHLDVIKCLDLIPENVVCEGSFFQKPTARDSGCQIDYLIETKFGTLFVCEVKFASHPIGLSICAEVDEKLKRLRVPRNVSVRPVLIHVNGVTDELRWSNYFTFIVNFADLFDSI